MFKIIRKTIDKILYDRPIENDIETTAVELEEFIKSLYDYTSNTFPKGETAVLTAVEKKYGESSMRPAAEMMKALVSGQDQEMERIKKLAGV